MSEGSLVAMESRDLGPVRVAIAEILASGSRFELEVGSGKGLFLCQVAKQFPTTRFLGIELAQKYAAMAQARLERLGISNAHVYSADGVAVVADVVPDSSVDSLHVYFPDPWWKARHKKRRVLNERMLHGIERALKPGGQFHFWTDVLDYYESTLELIANVTKLQGHFSSRNQLLSTISIIGPTSNAEHD